MKIIIGLLMIGLVVWLAWGALHPKSYTGFFYYNTNNLSQYWKQDGLKDLDACRGWVNMQITRDNDGVYDYECGRNCTFRQAYTAVVCEKTER